MNGTVIRLLTPRHGDARGWFSETWSERRFRAAGVECRFVQDNQSRSEAAGVVRGLHFQHPPFAQAKLVRCLRGAILDVVVDIRAGSPTFGRGLGVELSEANGEQLFIPAGFAHGFATLTPGAEVAYKVSAPYSPEHEGGLAWDDPALDVKWPIARDAAALSARDQVWPRLDALDTPFTGDAPMRLAVVNLGDIA